MTRLLSFNSELSEHPKDVNIKLKNHQLAMLKKCQDIENIENNNFGIMSDKPGTGKTYVILSLIYESISINKTNIIIVPQNIYSQWVTSIENFSQKLTYRKFINYENIISLYNDSSILSQNDIILTTASYYHIIATTLESLEIKINRIFFDEIDSISNIICTKINCDFIWFVSASFNVDYIGYYNKKLDIDNIENITCKCESAFIDANIFLENPIKTYFLCKNTYVDNILDNILSEKELHGLNAMDYTLYNKEFEKQKAKNEKEVIELLLHNRKAVIQFENIKLEDAKNKIKLYEEFKLNKKLHEDNYFKNISSLNIFSNFKSSIFDLFKDYESNTSFYLDIKNISDKDGEKIIREHRRTEIKTLKNILDDILELLYNLSNIYKICNEYYEKRIMNSNLETLQVNLKQIIIFMNNIYEIIYKINSSIITNIDENNLSNITIFYNIFLETKNFINEFMLNFSNFEHAIKAESQLEIYNKIVTVSNESIIKNETKINLIYDRLNKNNCCPVCYEFFETLETNKIYITSTCCNNKICENCINGWYDLNKSSCIFCNIPNIYKDDLLFFEKDNSDKKENLLLNQELIKNENIKFEQLNYSKNIYLKNFILNLKNVEKKVIIFSDYSNIFEYIETICIENEINYVDLDKGNIKSIDISVNEYKYGNAKILLSNSTLFGCGMNFENSTDIIFVHKMSKDMEEQVIGRAQRLGRKTILNINYLQYENESELIINKKVENVYADDIDKDKILEEFYNEKQYSTLLDNLQHIELNEEFELPDIPSEIIDVNLESLIQSLS
jgi:superfamily II DNA or RNA helicase